MMTARFLPSIPAAIVTGAVLVPIGIAGHGWIERTTNSSLCLMLWIFFTFILPVAFSTGDTTKWWREGRRYGFFRVRVTRTDWRDFYVPAWKRMAILFLSTVASVLLLKFFGVKL